MQLSFTRTSKAKTKAPVLEMVFCQPKMDDFLDEKKHPEENGVFYIPSYNIKIFEDPFLTIEVITAEMFFHDSIPS